MCTSSTIFGLCQYLHSLEVRALYLATRSLFTGKQALLSVVGFRLTCNYCGHRPIYMAPAYLHVYVVCALQVTPTLFELYS